MVNSVHDVSSGGILVTLSEMSIQNKIGALIKLPENNIKIHEYLFGEDQSRYIIEVEEKNMAKVSKFLKGNNIFFEKFGITQKSSIEIKNILKADVNYLEKLHKYWFNNYFNEII